MRSRLPERLGLEAPRLPDMVQSPDGDVELRLHLDYGRRTGVDAAKRSAARAAGLALCARWAQEAEELAGTLGR